MRTSTGSLVGMGSARKIQTEATIATAMLRPRTRLGSRSGSFTLKIVALFHESSRRLLSLGRISSYIALACRYLGRAQKIASFELSFALAHANHCFFDVLSDIYMVIEESLFGSLNQGFIQLIGQLLMNRANRF